MAEYTAVALQTILENENAIFTDTAVKCTKGYVIHRDGSGMFTLRGITNGCFARYRIAYNANIAVPTGGTFDGISVSLAIAGETLGEARAIVTPAAAEAFFNVSGTAIIDVPRGCCVAVTLRNTSIQDINMQNANITIDRIA